ncbi:hypothetical protein TKK_0002680 [Trichogramma kaykai]|uniref:UBC core domain-containing protein n=1 Tax=Trichogramma kaykai TaxID=54128 RepID=A0ABD2XQM3_9HYME
MAFENKFNTKSSAVKRLMKEAQELHDANDEYCAYPLEENIFEWHFTIQGPPSTDFEGGIYHGKIILPPEYPMKPPNIILLTPNGRFEVNKKICLSISDHHPETWQPLWSIRTALLALIAFMPSPANGTIGSLDYAPEERRKLAWKSLNWECDHCGKIVNLLSQNKSRAREQPLLSNHETSGIDEISSTVTDTDVRERRFTSSNKNITVPQERHLEPMNGVEEDVNNSNSSSLNFLIGFLLFGILFLAMRRLLYLIL